MGTIAKLLVVLIVGAGLIVWSAKTVRAYFPNLHASLPTFAVVPPIAVNDQNSSGLIANAVSSQIQTSSLTGTVVLDSSSGVANIPYIAYTDQKGRTATKQLIFDDTRGCSSYAGDFPCVNRAETAAYPKLVNGAPITVTGELYEDRFIVDSIKYQ